MAQAKEKVTAQVDRLNQTSPKASTRQGLKGGTHASPPATQGKEKYGCRILAEIYLILAPSMVSKCAFP